MNKNLAWTVLTTALIFSEIGCSHRLNYRVYKANPYSVKSKEGFDIVVFQTEKGPFIFYADKNNDGWADSKGYGIYNKNGLSVIRREIMLPPKTTRMEELMNKK